MKPETLKTKECVFCHKEFPATNDYFHRHAHSRDGLHHGCKKCRRAQSALAIQKKRADAGFEDMEVKLAPKIPVEKTTISDGVTRVCFGLGWKPSRDGQNRMNVKSGVQSSMNAF